MRSLPLFLILALILASCASIGRPEGGPRDEEPPVFVSSTPAPGAVNVDPRRMTVLFNENIQLEDAFTKVVASPPGKTPPTVRANGRRMTVEFRDTLLPNTTYTIDFADAIKDLNEGNILDGFALEFSTGPTIDTLRVSGMVLDARTLEPQQGILVGIHSNLADSALTSLPFERIARTNQYGQFTVRGLAPGEYRVYAVDDVNHDYKWDRSENLAFFPLTVSPAVEHITVSDTLRNSLGEDSLISRQGFHYLPDDILLTTFNEGHKAQYLKDYTRPERRKVNITFAAPADSLAELRVVDGVVSDSMRGASWSKWALMTPNATRDTLDYWITSPEIIASDSLRLSLRYQKTDTAQQLVWTTDTLRFFFREPKGNKKKEETDTLPPVHDALSFRTLGGTSQELNQPLIVEFSEPVTELAPEAMRLEILRDTLWTPLSVTSYPDSLKPLLRRKFDLKWEPGGRYRLAADSAAILSVYGEHNKAANAEFTVKTPDDYSNLTFSISGLDGRPAEVLLLTSGDEPAYRTSVAPGKNTAEFSFLAPGTYYARLFIDENLNHKWDPGNFADGTQPEETYYFAKKLELKKNWDLDQTWDLYELAVDAQKPYAIKKNKPKLKRGEQNPEEEEGDGFDSENEQYNPFGGTGSQRPGGSNRPTSRPGLNTNNPTLARPSRR